MGNTLGYIRMGRCGTYISRRIPFTDEEFYLCDLPENMQDAPEGHLVYVDRNGRLQTAEDDFSLDVAAV